MLDREWFILNDTYLVIKDGVHWSAWIVEDGDPESTYGLTYVSLKNRPVVLVSTASRVKSKKGRREALALVRLEADEDDEDEDEESEEAV